MPNAALCTLLFYFEVAFFFLEMFKKASWSLGYTFFFFFFVIDHNKFKVKVVLKEFNPCVH